MVQSMEEAKNTLEHRLAIILRKISRMRLLEKFVSNILEATEVLNENQDGVSYVNFLR